MRPRPMKPHDFCAAAVAEKALRPAGDVEEAIHARHNGDATLEAALIVRCLQSRKGTLGALEE